MITLEIRAIYQDCNEDIKKYDNSKHSSFNVVGLIENFSRLLCRNIICLDLYYKV